MEYRYTACKKEIKSLVLQCKVCVKAFFHTGCVNKHKTIKDREVVKYDGPFKEISLLSDTAEMKRTPTMSGTAGSVRQASVDEKIDWLVKTVKQIKDEVACKEEIKTVIKHIIREEMETFKREFKRELEEMKRNIQLTEMRSDGQRSYSEVAKVKNRKVY